MTMHKDDEFERRVAALEEKARLREDGPPDAAIIERQSRGIFLWADVRAQFERIHDPFLDFVWSRAVAVHIARTIGEPFPVALGPVGSACHVLSYMPGEKAPDSLGKKFDLWKRCVLEDGEDSRGLITAPLRMRAALVWLLFERHGLRRLHDLVIEMVQRHERDEELIPITHLTDQQRDRLLGLTASLELRFHLPLLLWVDSAGEIHTSDRYR